MSEQFALLEKKGWEIILEWNRTPLASNVSPIIRQQNSESEVDINRKCGRSIVVPSTIRTPSQNRSSR